MGEGVAGALGALGEGVDPYGVLWYGVGNPGVPRVARGTPG